MGVFNKKRARITGTVVVLLFFVLLFLGMRTLIDKPRHWVNTVIVSGVPVDAQQSFIAEVTPALHHPLVALNIDHLANQILHFAWVSDVTVRRIWPTTLAISVSPQALVATWNQDWGLNAYGEAFPLQQALPKDVVQLFGPVGGEIKAYGMYQQYQSILMPLKLQIAKVYQQADEAWLIVMDNGLRIQLGSQHVLTRLARFVKVYPNVFKSDSASAEQVVDLRYAHGMAISRGKDNG